MGPPVEAEIEGLREYAFVTIRRGMEAGERVALADLLSVELDVSVRFAGHLDGWGAPAQATLAGALR